jgi:hypothetical protein
MIRRPTPDPQLAASRRAGRTAGRALAHVVVAGTSAAVAVGLSRLVGWVGVAAVAGAGAVVFLVGGRPPRASAAPARKPERVQGVAVCFRQVGGSKDDPAHGPLRDRDGPRLPEGADRGRGSTRSAEEEQEQLAQPEGDEHPVDREPRVNSRGGSA